MKCRDSVNSFPYLSFLREENKYKFHAICFIMVVPGPINTERAHWLFEELALFVFDLLADLHLVLLKNKFKRILSSKQKRKKSIESQKKWIFLYLHLKTNFVYCFNFTHPITEMSFPAPKTSFLIMD